MGSWRLRVVVHPLTIAAVVLLGVNDHVLKQRWPGLVTGKLSDVAGVWMVGALLVAALGSVRWGAALTAVGFGLLKSVPVVAVWAAPVLGGVTSTDGTDLLALLVLWPLGRLATRLGARRPARVNDAWSTIGAVFVALSAVLVTSATSEDDEGSVQAVVLEGDDPVFRYISDGDNEADDGWYRLTVDDPVKAVAPGGSPTSQMCVDETCYSVAADGVYQDGVRISPPSLSGVGRSPDWFSSIVAIRRSDGIEVWVSMGRGGVLSLSTDGVWRSYGLLGAPSLDLSPEPRRPWNTLVVTALLLAFALPLILRKRRPRERVAWTIGLAVGGNLLTAVLLWAWLSRTAVYSGDARGLIDVGGFVLTQVPWLAAMPMGTAQAPHAVIVLPPEPRPGE